MLRDHRIKIATLDNKICHPVEAGSVARDKGGELHTARASMDADCEFPMRAGSDTSAVGAGHVLLTPVSLDFWRSRERAWRLWFFRLAD